MYRAADERAHSADAAGWWEAWQLDVASDEGVGVAVRLACAPAAGVAWWWTHVLVPGRTGPVVVRDHDVPLPRVGLEVRADGLWGEQVCETPFEHWTYGLEAFGVALDDPADSLRGEIGERLPVGFDLEWEVDAEFGEVHERRDDALRGYAQFWVVHGEVLLGRSRVAIDAVGRRAHTWGVPRCDRRIESAWARGSAVASTAVTELAVAARLGWFVVPIAGTAQLTRALCRFDAGGGRRGNGWSSTFEPG